MPNIISFDPGRNTGWAQLTRGPSPQLIASGEIRVRQDEAIDFDPVLNDALHSSVGGAIEAQYVGVNPDSAIKLARIAGRWAGICLRHGLWVRWINPSVWQRAALGVSPRAKRAERKRAAVAVAHGLYGVDKGPDVADAIMLGRYCAINEYFAGLGKEERVDG